VGIGEGPNLSTFGAVGDESKAGTLYSTDEWSALLAGNLGGNADPSVPLNWDRRILYYMHNGCFCLPVPLK